MDVSRFEIEATLMIRPGGLERFVKWAWKILNPNRPLVWGRYLSWICDHYEAIHRGEISGLIVNIPPRYMKSELTNIFFPAWEWLLCPHYHWIFASYSGNLTKRDSVRMRDLISSKEYRFLLATLSAMYPEEIKYWDLSPDFNERTGYKNTLAGQRLATSWQGTVTGEGGNRRVLDDLHSAADAESDAIRTSQLEFLQNTWFSRIMDPLHDADICIMQRLHIDDATGYILEELKLGWEHLRLPARFEPDERAITYHFVDGHKVEFFRDPRHEEGELLFPERFPEHVQTKIEERLGPWGTASQQQQRPTPIAGAIIRPEYWQYWVPIGHPLKEAPVKVKLLNGDIEWRYAQELPEEFDDLGIFCDAAFKDEMRNSRVAVQTWMTHNFGMYLLAAFAEHVDITGTIDAVLAHYYNFPQTRQVVIEDRANGPAVMQQIKNRVPNVIPMEPLGKIPGLNALAVPARAGNLYLPHPQLFGWVEEYIDELAKAPNGRYNDQADASAIMNYYFSIPVGVDPDETVADYVDKLLTEELPEISRY